MEKVASLEATWAVGDGVGDTATGVADGVSDADAEATGETCAGEATPEDDVDGSVAHALTNASRNAGPAAASRRCPEGMRRMWTIVSVSLDSDYGDGQTRVPTPAVSGGPCAAADGWGLAE